MALSEKIRITKTHARRKNGCEHLHIHQDTVDLVSNTMPDEETLNEASVFFRMFGDATRMKILHALFVSELCVCDLAALLGVSQSAVSHQLNSLRQTNLVKFRREGKTVFYSLKDEHVKLIVDMGMKHVLEKKFPGSVLYDKK